jgi:hypothetical protein
MRGNRRAAFLLLLCSGKEVGPHGSGRGEAARLGEGTYSREAIVVPIPPASAGVTGNDRGGDD